VSSSPQVIKRWVAAASASLPMVCPMPPGDTEQSIVIGMTAQHVTPAQAGVHPVDSRFRGNDMKVVFAQALTMSELLDDSREALPVAHFSP
jgi:hypothetical protein